MFKNLFPSLGSKSRERERESKPLRRFVKFLFVFLFLSVSFFGPQTQVQAAALTQTTATPSNVTAGATVSYTVIFKTTTTILNNGKITIQFPDGFNVSGATFTSWTGFDGGQTLSVSGQVITLTRNATGTSSTAGSKTIVLGNIINSSTTANNYQVTVTTKSTTDATLDGATSSIYFQIFSTNTETPISGIYYLRDDLQTHYQHSNSIGTGGDTGTLSKTVPSSNESRQCSDWAQFYFDVNGTYTQTNQVSNIYYHVWWASSNNAGNLGYDKTGSYNVSMSESFAINATNSPNQVGSFYLYAGKQTFATPQNILGNEIYNLSIKIYSSTKYPEIISFSNRSSFIIPNLPDNIDTLGLSQDGNTDQDGDGLSDYDELFTRFTNPYVADTDGDGWNDKYEIDQTTNPVDPDSAPSFVPYFNKFNGGATNDFFGTSVSSITDVDGDGKDDIIVGARGADPNGMSSAGSVYLYSSITNNLLKQFNGNAIGDFFGSSVSSISDIDGDGKKDVVVGAKYANSYMGGVYIYSSGTGNLLKQYSGDTVIGSFGFSVSTIQDLDADGKDDVIISSPDASPGGLTSAGSVYIYSSNTGNLLRQFNGETASDNFGTSVSSISDIDGDGKEDVVVGANNANPGNITAAGSVYIFSSSTGNLLKQYNGTSKNQTLGTAVSSIVDLDGDNKKDIIVGAPYYSPGNVTNAGEVYIFSSVTGNTIKTYTGANNYDFFGSTISVISDIDNDGKEDVLIGSNRIWTSSTYRGGSSYIYSSVTGNLLKQYNGELASDSFGSVITSITDIDGDGKNDVIIGAINTDPNGLSNAGSAYIYSSAQTGIPTQTWTKGNAKNTAFDLDNYFSDTNNLTLPARNQTVTYTASTNDNPYVDITIDSDNKVSFSQPAEWAGNETVTFTAKDPTDLSTTSPAINLAVSGTSTLNTPTIGTAIVNSPTSITWTWTDNSEIEQSYRVDYVNNGGGTANDVDGLNVQTTKSSAGTTLSWTDDDLTPGTQYSVHVHAFRTDTGESTASDIATATTSTPTSSSTSSPSAPVCDDQTPGTKAPWLYGAIAQNNNSVLLYFTPADEPVSKYVLEYGIKSGEYPYGVQDMGVNSRGQMTYLVKSLSPNTTYYFKVRGGNGCATGTWSNEIAAKTKGLVSYDQLDITSSELIPVKEALSPQSCQTYTVKSGDTLWSIASNLLGVGSKYKDIIEQNKDKYSTLETSNDLKTGWELKINCKEERPASAETMAGKYDVNVKVVDTNKKPVEGATVTIHSNPQTAETNKYGIATFKNVEAGEHKVLIAYNNFEGEQSVNLTGDVKKFELNVTVKQKAISFSPLAYGIIVIMGIVIVILIITRRKL